MQGNQTRKENEAKEVHKTVKGPREGGEKTQGGQGVKTERGLRKGGKEERRKGEDKREEKRLPSFVYSLRGVRYRQVTKTPYGWLHMFFNTKSLLCHILTKD